MSHISVDQQKGQGITRLLSVAELIIGALVVIGHNVFKLLPSEVVILSVAGLISIRWRNGSLSAMGLKRPESWRRILLIALAAAALRIVLGEYVIDPITGQFWPPAKPPEGINEITGNIKIALLVLMLVWSYAAIGEEIAYRGYLLTRAAEAGNNSVAAYLIAALITSLLFGYGHYYKGPAGIIDSGIAGLILASAYLLAGRNLWVSILAHGFIDTFGLTLVYFDLAD